MEEDWWNTESSQKFSSDTPPAIVIVDAQKGSNILSGDVNMVSESLQSGVWNQIDHDKNSKFPSWAWFLTGLILVPIILLLTTSILMVFADSSFNNEYYSNYPKQVDDVTFNGKIFEVHTFSMTTGFEDIFATHSYWDIAIEGEHNGEYWNSYISGNYNAPHQLTTTDSIDNEWYESFVYKQNQDNQSLYVKVIVDDIYVATKPGEPPNFVNYWGESTQTGTELISFVTCLIWPIVIIGGSIWGFATNRKPFTYGIITMGALVFLAFLFLILALLATF